MMPCCLPIYKVTGYYTDSNKLRNEHTAKIFLWRIEINESSKINDKNVDIAFSLFSLFQKTFHVLYNASTW